MAWSIRTLYFKTGIASYLDQITLTKILLPPRNGSLKIAWGLDKMLSKLLLDEKYAYIYVYVDAYVYSLCTYKCACACVYVCMSVLTKIFTISYYRITSLSSPGACPVLEPS